MHSLYTYCNGSPILINPHAAMKICSAKIVILENIAKNCWNICDVFLVNLQSGDFQLYWERTPSQLFFNNFAQILIIRGAVEDILIVYCTNLKLFGGEEGGCWGDECFVFHKVDFMGREKALSTLSKCKPWFSLL